MEFGFRAFAAVCSDRGRGSIRRGCALYWGHFLASVATALAVSLSIVDPGHADDATYSAALKAVQESPADPERSLVFVQAAIQSGQIRPAISRLESLLLNNPGLANIRLELGLLYLEAGSPQRAEAYIAEALKSPDAPAPVRARAEDALRRARRQQETLSYELEASVGMLVESNATAAPDEIEIQIVSFGQEVLATLDTDDTEESDVSLLFSAGGQIRYDFGTQARDELVFTAGYFGTRYKEQTQLDLDIFTAELGPEIRLNSRLGIDGFIRPYVTGAFVLKSASSFEADGGGGVDFEAALGPRTLALGRLDARYTDFQVTPDDPTNNDRDAILVTFSPRVLHQLSSSVSVLGGFGIGLNDAEVGFESYRQGSATVRGFYVFDDPFEVVTRPVTSSLGATYRFRQFSEPDPVIDVDDSQRDQRIDLSLFLSIPITEEAAIAFRGGYVLNRSNYEIEEFDNLSFSTSLDLRF